MSDLKQCTKCKEWKPRIDFHKCNKNKDGFKCKCKACRNEESRDYEKTKAGQERRQKPEAKARKREYMRQYRQTEASKESKRRYVKSEKGREQVRRCVERRRARDPEWVERRKEYMSQYNKQRAQTKEYKEYRRWYDDTPEQVRRRRKYYNEYKKRPKTVKQRREYMRRYREENPETAIKNRARCAVYYAVGAEKMPHQSTLPCGTKVNLSGVVAYPAKHCHRAPVEYHHYLGYREEHRYDVQAVCKTCHIKAHKA